VVAVNDKPVLEIDTVRQWEAWLEANAGHDGVRLRLRKKASTAPGITYDEALDVALCFGWIDGQIKGLDADYHLQVFTPRRRVSPWSQRNRDHIERLTAAGRMRESGLAEVQRAKADGRWDAAYRVKDAPVPEDFQAALDGSPAAAAFFASLRGAARFAFLFRLMGLKRPETRSRRIAEYVVLLERGERLG
jgi:uncharacterized protein YdeI (YjbR/CyaY-like superfamily)